MSIKKVVDNGFCVGCGGCKSTLNEDVKITIHDDGFYKAKFAANVTKERFQDASHVCPFSNTSSNEDELASELFNNHSYDERVGFYTQVYAGKVKNKEKLITSSSGGLTSWFAEKLLDNDEIDAVVHVGQTEHMFEYRISKNKTELNKKINKKSRYYPVSYENLVDYILNTNDRLLFIGVPCFVKSIRLIQKKHKLENIRFVFSLLCGHMKSTGFAESLAWQGGVTPKELTSLDFRVKKQGYKASDYFIEAESEKLPNVQLQNKNLLGTNWGHGFFKHKACDYCDDLAGELADVSFGDAWLPQYEKDYLGTNIVLSRNATFDKYIKLYKNEVECEKLSVSDFYDTQAGNYRHRRDGLVIRTENEKGWYPKKRLYLSKNVASIKRQKLYLYRYLISRKSINNFKIAKKYNNFYIFKVLMFPMIVKYDYLNKNISSFFLLYLKKAIPKNVKSMLKGEGKSEK